MANDKTVVIGLGNILCGDDGFGVHVVEKLYETWDFPQDTMIIDGGTRGPALFCFIEEADNLLIFDAVDFGLVPGELCRRDNSKIPLWLGAKKISVHQNSFAELLALAELKNSLPQNCILIGLQPCTLKFGAGLSRIAAAKIGKAAQLGLECLNDWGIYPSLAATPKNLLNKDLLQSNFCPQK